MAQTKYQQVRPEGMFTVNVTRTTVQDSPLKMHYEYGYTVELLHTENDFVNLFAALVVRQGKKPASTYAAMVGTGERQLLSTLQTLTGAGIREWTEAFVCALAEALLRRTDWTVARIASEAKFSSVSIFSRWFRAKYRCSPGEWR